MMKKPTKIIAIIFAGGLFSLVGTNILHAGKYGHCRGQSCQDKMAYVMEKLDLSDSQHEKITAIREIQRSHMTPLKDKMASIREAMEDQVKSDKFDIEEIRDLAHSKALITEQVLVLKAESMHQIYQHLTPEQRNKLEQMRDKMKKRYHH